jgi:hypothetical protein
VSRPCTRKQMACKHAKCAAPAAFVGCLAAVREVVALVPVRSAQARMQAAPPFDAPPRGKRRGASHDVRYRPRELACLSIRGGSCSSTNGLASTARVARRVNLPRSIHHAMLHSTIRPLALREICVSFEMKPEQAAKKPIRSQEIITREFFSEAFR